MTSLFHPSHRAPHVYGMPPGVDFPAQLVQGLTAAYAGQPPTALARVQLIVNTRRMARRIRELFDKGPAVLMPRIQLVSDLADQAAIQGVPAAVSPLKRRLEITNLVSRLLDTAPDLAPRSALYDLSDSLAGLMDEMHGEGVSPEALFALDVSNHSEHWARSLKFLQIVHPFFDTAQEPPDRETRQRMIVQNLAATWAQTPPDHPVILAGSTGSRGTTMLLMQAIAKLPQGAIVLPGFDFGMPSGAWADLDDALTAEDHPQFRFRVLMRNLGIESGDIRPWSPAQPPSPERNALVSLALRPAPVTDQWLHQGPDLGPLAKALENVTLLQANSQRDEALAIALRLRQAAEDGKTAALITPDRMLTRQVTAALDRWDIVPDDSAGTPLHLTPPGRLLRHVAALFHRPPDAEALITLLTHPLAHSGQGRGQHLIWARELELHLRKKAMPYPTPADLAHWATGIGGADCQAWAEWAGQILAQYDGTSRPLAQHIGRHIALAESVAQGPMGQGSGGLWLERAGIEAQKQVADLRDNADAGGHFSPLDYADLFGAILSQAEVRDRDAPHPKILIWGTLEARVQGADLLILGGLNDGTWPELPKPDPWLNRQMRQEAGMMLPERRIGLSAHDFQQAIAAPEVWLTRPIRSDDAQTVPSRWLNRLTNLLQGLPNQGGPEALNAAKERGDKWLQLAAALEAPHNAAPAPRPSPRPPVDARPRQLSVTEIKRLIRDPYAIYAKHVLRLRPLDPLMRQPDALRRGIVVHEVFEKFIASLRDAPSQLTSAHLMQLADQVLAQAVPWPEIRLLWQAKLARVADWFIATEEARQTIAPPGKLEAKAQALIPQLAFTLTAQADRIDIDAHGLAYIYDYKTGTPPTKPQQAHFDKQLLLEAAMLTQGAFEGLAPMHVQSATFIGLGSSPSLVAAPLDEHPPHQVWQEFIQLITRYLTPDQGFTARRALFKETDVGDYDHLARYGEWDTTTPPSPEDLT